MKVHVRKSDIEDGRLNAGSTCGCPIWHALVRKLGIAGSETYTTHLLVPNVHQAKLGKITIPLPNEAVEFQETLMNDSEAKVKPFTFETELNAPK